MADESSISGELSRDLGLFHITMMGLGMMIGAGVFVGIGICMEGAGPGGLLVAFALNGLIAVFSAMSFAELSSAIPRAGGAYNFARIGFGRGPSFIAGWMEWLASSAAEGFYAVVFALAATAAAEGEIHILDEQPHEQRHEGRYNIMVAVSNPDNALALVQNTYKLCGAKGAHVELLHMVPVPDQVPLTDAERYMLEGKEGILETILEQAKEYDLVVLGCTSKPILRQMTGSPVPETVARLCEVPLVMVKASRGIRSWVKRWI